MDLVLLHDFKTALTASVSLMCSPLQPLRSVLRGSAALPMDLRGEALSRDPSPFCLCTLMRSELAFSSSPRKIATIRQENAAQTEITACNCGKEQGRENPGVLSDHQTTINTRII